MGNQLSGGGQQMLSTARALMTNLRLSLLDEPLEGLAPLIAQELLAAMAHMVGGGNMAVILVEQHAHRILPLSRHAIILEHGHLVHTGPSEAITADSSVLERWLCVSAR